MRSVRQSATSSGLSILLLLFTVLTVVIVLFSQRILDAFFNPAPVARTIFVLIAIGLPLSLLGIIAFQIARLFSQRIRRHPGARLKTRLMLFFALVVLLAAVPTAVISVNFISSGIDVWLRTDIGQALDAGESIVVNHYRQAVEGLRALADSQALTILHEAADGDYRRLWTLLSATTPSLSFLQVISREGKAIAFLGDPRGSGAVANLDTNRNGSLARVDRDDLTILRHATRRGDESLILGSVLPSGFAGQARQVSNARETMTQIEEFRGLFRNVTIGIYLFLAFPIVLVSILVSFLLADELILPVVGLVKATRRVADGDFSFRIVARYDDDLSVLVRSFNRMITELSASREKLLKAEKISAWSDIAQRLAHEIRNPLTPIKLSAERLLRKWRGNPDSLAEVIEPAVSAIITEVESLNRMLIEFREFARLPDPQLKPLVLKELVNEVLQIHEPLMKGVQLDAEQIPGDLIVPADRSQLRQVFSNLIHNSLQAMSGTGELGLRADVVSKDGVEYCRIQVRDSGVGIDPTTLDQVFEPYVTTKRDGSGLGLAIVERVVFDHKGVIWYESQPGVGTTFYVDLPMQADGVT